MNNTANKLWTKEFVILTLSNLFLFLTLQMLLSTLPVYAKEAFGANATQVSLITSLFAFSAIASRLFSSKALENGKRRQLLYIGLFLSLLAVFGYYLASGIGFLLLMRVLFGIGFGMTSTSFPTMASDIIPAKRLGEGMGYFGLSTTLAMSIGPMIGLTLLQGGGFTPLVFLTAAINIIIFPLAFLLTSRTPKSHKEPAPVPIEKDKKTSVMRRLLLPSVLNFLISITYGGLLSFLALYGKEVHLSNPQYFFLFNALAIILIRPISGRLYDRFGHKALLVPGAICMLAGLLLLTYSTSIGGLLLSAICYGLGFGSLQPSLQTWMIQEVPPQQRGMANGTFLNSLDFGVAIGSMLLGVIASYSSYAVMYRYSAIAPALVVIIYIVALILKTSSSTSKQKLTP
ncbi:MFS transporter [Paenibacillus sp. GCM10028914]|uniref:MFS transporter n=1 Tax=Paenibacillus sp. GCM10028914 TaxID=3273416 RepID=UPI003617C55B